jgi:hypothetical protein
MKAVEQIKTLHPDPNSFLKVARAGERSRDLSISFIFSFHPLDPNN